MEYITTKRTVGNILCCECGIPTEPNPVNKCIACIRTQHDISEDIPKSGIVYNCSGCERYYEPPSNWIHAPRESSELLSYLLKKIKGITKTNLKNAEFEYTEPHSKRLKVMLAIEKEVYSAVLEQSFIVEFTINHMMCNDCHRVEAKDHWNALVQVRQKTDHKKTFYYIEQLILKHKMHNQALGMKQVHGGLDFFYANEQAANRLLDLLMTVVPCRWSLAKKLKSHDVHSNTFNYKRSYSVELVPVCKDNLVCLPAKLARRLGSISQLCIVHRVTNLIFLIDPTTAQMAEMNSTDYWKTPFLSLCSSKKLIEYIVIDVEESVVRQFKGQGHLSSKHQVGDVSIQRASELGSGETIICKSHLGHLLKPGDSVKGFDIRNANINDDEFDKLDAADLPDVILIRKCYGDTARRNRKRKWKLRHLGIDDDTSSQNRDYIDFLEDLEEDDQMRKTVNIYKNVDKMNCYESESEAGEEIPSVSLEEMMEELNVIDEPDVEEDEN